MRKTISVSFPDEDELKKIDGFAEAAGMNRSEYMRRCAMLGVSGRELELGDYAELLKHLAQDIRRTARDIIRSVP